MPFNIGAHPAFKIDYNILDYCLEFNVLESFKSHKLRDGLFAEEIEFIKSKDNIVFLSEKLFENDALVFKNINSNSFFYKKSTKQALMLLFYITTMLFLFFFVNPQIPGNPTKEKD